MYYFPSNIVDEVQRIDYIYIFLYNGNISIYVHTLHVSCYFFIFLQNKIRVSKFHVYILYTLFTRHPKKKTNFEISIERENRDEFEKSKIPRVSTVGKRDVKHHACRVNRFVVARHAHTNSKSGITRSVETSTAVPPMY